MRQTLHQRRQLANAYAREIAQQTVGMPNKQAAAFLTEAIHNLPVSRTLKALVRRYVWDDRRQLRESVVIVS